jgi:murein DD-endopeptidase MepM/ murein hydrolase activator NlpD
MPNLNKKSTKVLPVLLTYCVLLNFVFTSTISAYPKYPNNYFSLNYGNFLGRLNVGAPDENADQDSDGLTYLQEKTYCKANNYPAYNPFNPDSDNDGILDGDEDFDNDGVTNTQELNILNTLPDKADTNDNGVNDGNEDFDSDGLNNKLELNTYGTNPLTSDTDGDGLFDGAEVNTYHTDPLNPDTDGDSFTDKEEIDGVGTNHQYKTDPLLRDTDGDLINDFDEVQIGLNPLQQKTNGTTIDSERTFSGTISEDSPIVALINENNPYNVSIEATVAGNLQSAKVDRSVYTVNFETYGDIIDINYQENLITPSVKVSFEIPDAVQTVSLGAELPQITVRTLSSFAPLTDLTNFIIFKNINGKWYPVTTYYDYENKKITAATDKTGTYALVDFSKVLSTVATDFNNSDAVNYFPEDYDNIVKNIKKGSNGKLYFVIADNSKNWDSTNNTYTQKINQALSQAGYSSATAHLATITSSDEQSAVKELIKNKPYGFENFLLGLNYANSTEGWKWVYPDNSVNYSSYNNCKDTGFSWISSSGANYQQTVQAINYNGDWQFKNSANNYYKVNQIYAKTGYIFEVEFNGNFVCESNFLTMPNFGKYTVNSTNSEVVLSSETMSVDKDKDSISDWNEIDKNDSGITILNNKITKFPTFDEYMKRPNKAYINNSLDNYYTQYQNLGNHTTIQRENVYRNIEKLKFIQVLPLVSDPNMADSDDDGIADPDDIYGYLSTEFETGVNSYVTTDKNGNKVYRPVYERDIEPHNKYKFIANLTTVNNNFSKRFDVVKTGLNQNAAISSTSGISVYSYPTSSAIIKTLNFSNNIVVVGVFQKSKLNFNEYWLKIRMSDGIYGYVRDGSIYTTFNNIYIKNSDYNNVNNWVYPLHKETVVGSRFSEYVRHGIYLSSAVGKAAGYGGTHHGYDIVSSPNLTFASTDTPVYSPVNGTVIVATRSSTSHGNNEDDYTVSRDFGNSVLIETANGYTIRLAHFRSLPLVKTGDKVTPYAMVATAIGDTGMSAGYHVHIEVKKNGDLKNPLYYFQNQVTFYSQFNNSQLGVVNENP